MAAILPRIYPQMLDEVHAHQDAGRPTFIVSAAGNDVVEPLAAGARHGRRHRHPLRGRRRRQLHRPPRRALRLRRGQGRGDARPSPPSTRSTSPPPTPTPTRSPTCRCCARSATRSPSTPTRRWPRSPARRAGRRCASSGSAAACVARRRHPAGDRRRLRRARASPPAASRRPRRFAPRRPLDCAPWRAEPRRQAASTSEREARVRDDLGAADRAALHRGRPAGPRGAIGLPGRVPVHPRRLPVDVPRAALDDAPVRRLRHGRGDQRALPLPARPRPDRALDRLRHADPDGLRLRPRAQPRRGRPRGRRGRHPRRHGDSSSPGSRSAGSRPR